MDTLEALNARHAAAVSRLNAELELAAKCPVAPKRVQVNSSAGMAPWITYECASIVDALDVLRRLGETVPFYGREGTFLRYTPDALANDKSGETVSGPFAASIATSQGRGFGPDATLKAFFMAGDTLAQAHIRLHGFNGGHAYGAAMTRQNVGTARNPVYRTEWRPNAELSAETDHLTRWGSGSDDAVRYEYLLSADTVDGGAEHATEMLWHIAERARRATFTASPMVESFLSVLMQDLQMRENEEALIEGRTAIDCGTIYTAPESTFRYAVETCRAFESAFHRDAEAREAIEANAEQAGSDLYLEAAGHGAGFADRTVWHEDRDTAANIAGRLSDAVGNGHSIETYIGDDGRAYVAGREA